MRRAYVKGSLAGLLLLAGAIVMAPALSFPLTERKKQERKLESRRRRRNCRSARLGCSRQASATFSAKGPSDGTQRIDLTFATQDINDLIKSMTLRDLDNGQITAVSYDSNVPSNELYNPSRST